MFVITEATIGGVQYKKVFLKIFQNFPKLLKKPKTISANK